VYLSFSNFYAQNEINEMAEIKIIVVQRSLRI